MIGRLNHVAIAVGDIRRASKLYRDTLGADVSAVVPQPDHGVNTVFVTLPNTKIELLEPLLFIVNRLLDQLCTRLRMHILAIGEVRVTLTLERNESRSSSQSNSQNKAPLLHIRTVRLPVPAKEGKFLLKLLQLDLEAHPPTSPVTAISIVAIPAKTHSRQLGLFLPLSPDPERLEITLARIQSTVGEGRVGSPALLNTHRPNAFQQTRFAQPEAAGNINREGQNAKAALRIYRPPLAANVEMRVLRPKRHAGSVEASAEETALYRIYKDQFAKRWFVEGIYD